jgi:ribonuclease Z
VHEALAPQLVEVITRGATAAGRPNLAQITVDILDYHTSPVEAAEVARDAGVGHLLYNHIVPPLLLRPMQGLFLEGVAEVYDGPVTIGRDGTLVVLEAGSDAIAVEERL